MSTILVFAIEEFSVYDGPGIRTTVFLKGCPLRCNWCHNPEGQSFKNEIRKNHSACIGCGACLRADKSGELTEAGIAACPSHALRLAAAPFSAEELVARLLKNREFLTGGVTFSGGEPLAHPVFLKECLSQLDGVLHRAVQTCGFAEPAVFEALLPHMDYVLFDLKLIDNELHRRFTGVDNTWILKNFETLCKSGVPFTVRTPLIPTVTDTADNLAAIARLLQQNNVKAIELLPYHTAAGGKYASVGRIYAPLFDETVPPIPRTELFEQYGIVATVL